MFSFFLIQGTVILLFGNGLLDHANKKPVASWCMASGHIWGYTFTLVMRGSRKGEEIEGKSERSRPHSLNKSNFHNSEKQTNQKKKQPQTNKQNRTHENYSSEPPPPVLDPCMLDTLIPFRLITRYTCMKVKII